MKPDLAFGRLEPGEGTHQLSLAVALDTGHADNLPARHLEGNPVETLAAESAHRKYGVPWSAVRLGRKGRAERPADDHVQQR